MDPLYVFEGYTVEDPWVIVLAIAHDYERLKEVPSDETNGVGVTDIGDQYARGTRSSYAVANWIRSMGYHARAFPGPMADALLLIPPAVASGSIRVVLVNFSFVVPIGFGTDVDGIQSHRNYVRSAGGAWSFAEDVGVSGDWILRLGIVPPPVPVELQSFVVE